MNSLLLLTYYGNNILVMKFPLTYSVSEIMNRFNNSFKGSIEKRTRKMKRGKDVAQSLYITGW